MLLSSPTSKIEIGPDGEMRLVGPIISLSGPRPGARDVLTGEIKSAVVEEATTTLIVEPEQAEPDTETPHYLLVIKGGSLPNVPGRADDFTWPPLRPTDEGRGRTRRVPGNRNAVGNVQSAARADARPADGKGRGRWRALSQNSVAD